MIRPTLDDPRWIPHDGADYLSVAPGSWIQQRDGIVLLIGDLNYNNGRCGCCSENNSMWDWIDEEDRSSTDVVAWIPSELEPLT